MTLMNKAFLVASSVLVLALTPARVDAQSFDASGTPGLSGAYLFRYVNFFNDSSGNVTESCSLTGTMTFDGKGKYTLSGTQLFDSMGAGVGSCSSLGGGTYGVQSNGMAQLDNPLYAATLFGTFAQPVLTASSTEDDYMDLFIAVQAPSASFSNSSFSGAYTAGTMDFLNASASLARQGYFTLNADGKGNISPFTVTGSAANLNTTDVTQSVSSSTYSLSGAAGGTVTFPGSSTDQTEIVAGTKALYVSADGNYVVGGSTGGSDMIFGFRAPSGTSSNALLNGTYFIAGMDANISSTNFLDAFYGSINAGNGAGDLLWHERFDDVVDIFTYDDTFNTPVTIGSTGTYNDGTYNYLVGANGGALLLIGSGSQFSLNIGVHAPSYTASSGVWLDPIGITNAANNTPITNAYAPGEFVSLYGNFGVSTQQDYAVPIPTELGGVQVLVNGMAAPVYLVSANQINALIPYEISGDYFATFQVIANGSKSNSVTVYVDNTSPGVYTLDESGVGDAAILHANYTDVSSSSPAQPGETVQLYMNGLGTVTPQVADGSAAPSSPLSELNATEAADFFVALNDGVDTPVDANVEYAGLAPGFAGLYQVNFTIPSTGLTNGEVSLGIETNEGFTSMATIDVSGFANSAAPINVRSLHRPKAPVAHRKALVKSHRRALPERALKAY
jgi:uncharacterized protein (TIGR03437 family)